MGSEERIYKKFFVYQALKLFQLYTGMKSCYQQLCMLQKDNQTEENKEKNTINFEVLHLESVPFTEKKNYGSHFDSCKIWQLKIVHLLPVNA